MTKYRKRVLSLLLTASMIFTMNSFAFGEEIKAGESAIEVEASDVVLTTDTEPTTETQPEEETAIVISADKILSENLATLSENFGTVTAEAEKGTAHTFVVFYDASIAYEGMGADWAGSKKVSKGKATPINVKVYYADNDKVKDPAAVSYNDVIVDDKGTVSANWKEATVKKVTIKDKKRATVKLDGSPLYAVKDSTYISGIQLADKDLKKEFNDAYKEVFKALKKNKTDKVSANGMIEGKTDSLDYVVAVFPAYIGNDEGAIKAIQDYFGKDASKYLNIVTADFSKTKYKENVPKKITTTFDGKKKVNLKPTTKPEKAKYMGYANKANAVDKTKYNGNHTYYVEADGNFCGNIYYTPAAK